MQTVKMSLKQLKALINPDSGLDKELSDFEVFSGKAEFPMHEEMLKNGSARIDYMSPDQYLMRCKELQGYEKTFKEYLSEVIVQEKVNKYYQAMSSGKKFPLIMLDYVTYMQEGRHRALAAKRCGIKSLPVIIIE